MKTGQEEEELERFKREAISILESAKFTNGNRTWKSWKVKIQQTQQDSQDSMGEEG